MMAFGVGAFVGAMFGALDETKLGAFIEGKLGALVEGEGKLRMVPWSKET